MRRLGGLLIAAGLLAIADAVGSMQVQTVALIGGVILIAAGWGIARPAKEG